MKISTTTTITLDELAKHLDDIVARAHDRGEQFVIERDGEPLIAISPVAGKKPLTWGEFLEWYWTIPRPDDRFADDLEEIQAAQGKAEFPEWPS